MIQNKIWWYRGVFCKNYCFIKTNAISIVLLSSAVAVLLVNIIELNELTVKFLELPPSTDFLEPLQSHRSIKSGRPEIIYLWTTAFRRVKLNKNVLHYFRFNFTKLWTNIQRDRRSSNGGRLSKSNIAIG